MHNDFLEELCTRIDEVSGNVEKEFGGLTALQLNWKPSEENWSIAQCIDHLIVSNEKYFPQLEIVISHRWKNSLWQNAPLLPGLFGKAIIKSVSPDTLRKAKTFGVFRPALSGIPVTIIKEFTSHNYTLKEFIERSKNANLDRIVITSPVSRLITFSLRHAYIILTSHEQRHFLQAMRVKEAGDFPG